MLEHKFYWSSFLNAAITAVTHSDCICIDFHVQCDAYASYPKMGWVRILGNHLTEEIY